MSGDKPEGCIFCTKPRQSEDVDNGILHRGRHVFVILNAYPYNPGHLMVVPYEHVQSLTEISSDAARELTETTRLCMRILSEAMGPEGMNIGINQGLAAGAGIADHVHQHVVPRWAGDTNFMTTVGKAKVLPELVQETYSKLAPRFRTLADSN